MMLDVSLSFVFFIEKFKISEPLQKTVDLIRVYTRLYVFIRAIRNDSDVDDRIN